MHKLRFSLTLVAALGVAVAANAGGSQGQPPATPNSNSEPAAAPRNAPRAAPDGGLGMALLGARVNFGGALVTGSGAVSSQNFTSIGFTGGYEVIFNRDVTGCVYNAIPLNVGNAIAVAAQPRSNNPNGVFLRFRSPSNNAGVDTEFYLTVYCGN